MTKTIEAAAALIKKNSRYLLCQRNRDDCYGNLWEFPGGTIEKKETPSETIKREISEELDVSINPVKILKEFFDKNEHLKIKVYLIQCLFNKGILKKKDCQNFGFFEVKDIEKLNLAPVDKKIFNYLKRGGK
ncbi:MAG: NUDIX domain-containing protein [Candidatus Omnitrophica bacterium]|nr:NUDIX domain-containing protein [Candidatus Omnitrophota bacterium]MCF7895356.1 NUDIX domain-containing protein [Candidatus Omnitrophota bacterium]